MLGIHLHTVGKKYFNPRSREGSDKQKKLRQFNEDELAEVFVSSEKHRFRLLDESDGTLYDYDSINNLDLQGGNSLDHPTAP